jgi:hypothetical protein
MEQKVYSRIVNKTAIAARVIDKKQPQRNFTSRELDDILAIDSWVQCDDCEKWRMLPPWVEPPGDEDTWTCKENIFDPKRSICSAKERDAKFYNRFFDAQVKEQQHLLQNGDNSKLGNQGEVRVTDQQYLLQNGDDSMLGNQGGAQVTEKQHLLQNGDDSMLGNQGEVRVTDQQYLLQNGDDSKLGNQGEVQVTEQKHLVQNGDNSKLGNQGEAQNTEQQHLLQNGENSKLGNQGEAQVTEQQHLLQNGDNSIVEKQAGETLGETQISAHVSEQNTRESGADADATVEDVEKIENTKKRCYTDQVARDTCSKRARRETQK